MTSRGLKKPPLADPGGSGSDKDSCIIPGLQEMAEPPSFVVKWRKRQKKNTFGEKISERFGKMK